MHYAQHSEHRTLLSRQRVMLFPYTPLSHIRIPVTITLASPLGNSYVHNEVEGFWVPQHDEEPLVEVRLRIFRKHP